MDITLNCNECGQSLVIDDSYAGSCVNCPKCEAPLRIQMPNPPKDAVKIAPLDGAVRIRIQGFLFLLLIVTLIFWSVTDSPPQKVATDVATNAAANVETSVATNAPTNVATKPIFLKNLTTGVRFDELPLKINRWPITEEREYGKEIEYYPFSFFDKESSLSVGITSSSIVHSYKLGIDRQYELLKSAMEQKLTEIEGREIKFSCNKVVEESGFGPMVVTTCTIISGSQRLVIRNKYSKEWPNDRMFSSSTLSLIDVGLRNQALDEKRKADARLEELKNAKAKKDI